MEKGLNRTKESEKEGKMQWHVVIWAAINIRVKNRQLPDIFCHASEVGSRPHLSNSVHASKQDCGHKKHGVVKN